MTQNLLAKVNNLIADIQRLDTAGKAQAIKRFVEGELALNTEPKMLSLADLTQIHSLAVTEMRTLPKDFTLGGHDLHSEYPELCRTVCVVAATASYLRGKGLIEFGVGFGPREKN
jgi:hypothetical protein